LNTTGAANTATGFATLYQNTTGGGNTAIGTSVLNANTIGTFNTGVGNLALNNNVTGNQNTAIGEEADVTSNNLSNATAIGYNAKVGTSNTIQLGNNQVTNVKTNGTLTAGAVTYPNIDGSNGQVLTANGNGTETWTTPNVSGTTNSIWISNKGFEQPSTPTGGVESFYGVVNGYFYQFLSLYNSLGGISQTRSYFTPPSSWGNGNYTITVYYLTSTANSGTIKLNVGVQPTTMNGSITNSNEFGGNNVGGFQYGSTNITFDLTAAANTTSFATRPLQNASYTQAINFANIDYAVVQLGRYMNQGYSYSDTYPDKVFIVGVKITKN